MSSSPSHFNAGAALPAWVAEMTDFLSAAFPNWKPTAATMAVYYDTLRDLEPRFIAAGTKLLVRKAAEFAPSAGQIRQEALRIRREAKPHPPECDCWPCVNALPLSDRWLRLSPSMRTRLEREQPDLARQLAEAVPPQVRARVGEVRRLLGFARAVPAERAEPSANERLDRFLNPNPTA